MNNLLDIPDILPSENIDYTIKEYNVFLTVGLKNKLDTIKNSIYISIQQYTNNLNRDIIKIYLNAIFSRRNINSGDITLENIFKTFKELILVFIKSESRFNDEFQTNDLNKYYNVLMTTDKNSIEGFLRTAMNDYQSLTAPTISLLDFAVEYVLDESNRNCFFDSYFNVREIHNISHFNIYKVDSPLCIDFCFSIEDLEMIEDLKNEMRLLSKMENTGHGHYVKFAFHFDITMMYIDMFLNRNDLVNQSICLVKMKLKRFFNIIKSNVKVVIEQIEKMDINKISKEPILYVACERWMQLRLQKLNGILKEGFSWRSNEYFEEVINAMNVFGTEFIDDIQEYFHEKGFSMVYFEE